MNTTTDVFVLSGVRTAIGKIRWRPGRRSAM
jgi:hypothetical protein